MNPVALGLSSYDATQGVMPLTEKPPEALHVLVLGYPEIQSRPGERLTFAKMLPIASDLVPLARDVPSISDFHIVLIRDIAGAAMLGRAFERLPEHRGVIAMGLRPFNPPYSYALSSTTAAALDRARYNDLWEGFLGKLEQFFKDSIKSEPESGRNIDLEAGSPFTRSFSRPGLSWTVSARLVPTSQLSNSLRRQETAGAIVGKPGSQSPQFEVFARNPGGSIVGALLRTRGPTVVFHPIPGVPQERARDSASVEALSAFARDLLDLSTRLLTPQDIGEPPPKWAKEAFPELRRAIEEAESRLAQLTESADLLVQLCSGTGTSLEDAVERALSLLGVRVSNVAAAGGQRDILAELGNNQYVIEVKGKSGAIDLEDISKFIVGNPKKRLIMVVNQYRQVPLDERRTKPKVYPPLTEAAAEAARTARTNGSIESFHYICAMDIAATLISRQGSKELVAAMKPL